MKMRGYFRKFKEEVPEVDMNYKEFIDSMSIIKNSLKKLENENSSK